MPASSVSAQTVAAGVRAEIVSPGVASVTAVVDLLFSPSPGVLTMRIPGSASAGSVALTASALEGSSGAIIFTVSSENAGALEKLIAELTASMDAEIQNGGQISGIATTGVIQGQGVQVVVIKASQGSDGGGTVTAIISYD